MRGFDMEWQGSGELGSISTQESRTQVFNTVFLV